MAVRVGNVKYTALSRKPQSAGIITAVVLFLSSLLVNLFFIIISKASMTFCDVTKKAPI